MSASDEARKTNGVVSATLKMHDWFHRMYERGDIDIRFCNKMLRYFLLVDKRSDALASLLAENGKLEAGVAQLTNIAKFATHRADCKGYLAPLRPDGQMSCDCGFSAALAAGGKP